MEQNRVYILNRQCDYFVTFRKRQTDNICNQRVVRKERKLHKTQHLGGIACTMLGE